MSRILLVDDSPHAQRMGERILSEEGYEVVTVSNADSALIRLEDVDPDEPLAEAAMQARAAAAPAGAGASGQAAEAKLPAAPFVAVIDAEQVRAAVTVALDAAMA